MPFILEGLITTRTPEGIPHIAPMGPEVTLLDFAHLEAPHFHELILKPYKTSTTLANLLHHKVGIFQITDQVDLIAQGAIGHWTQSPEFIPAVKIAGDVLKKSCTWYEFELTEIDLSQERTRLTARIIHQQTIRQFIGYNRARNAVIEAAILATRVNFLPRDEILAKFAELKILIDKTAGETERWSFELLQNYVLAHPRQT